MACMVVEQSDRVPTRVGICLSSPNPVRARHAGRIDQASSFASVSRCDFVVRGMASVAEADRCEPGEDFEREA